MLRVYGLHVGESCCFTDSSVWQIRRQQLATRRLLVHKVFASASIRSTSVKVSVWSFYPISWQQEDRQSGMQLLKRARAYEDLSFSRISVQNDFGHGRWWQSRDGYGHGPRNDKSIYKCLPNSIQWSMAERAVDSYATIRVARANQIQDERRERHGLAVPGRNGYCWKEEEGWLSFRFY